MKNFILTYCFIMCWSGFVSGQSKSDLEEERKKTLDEISYVDNLLKATTKQKAENTNALKMLGNKVNLRETVIKGMGEEINLLNERIELNKLGIEMMQNDLVNLKAEYSKTLINSYKLKKGNPEIVYILSAKDFNQGYKRLKYLQQVTKFRRNEAELITELKNQIDETRIKLEEDLLKMSELRNKEVQQKSILVEEQARKKKMLNTLGNQEKKLKKDLDEKKKIAQRLEKEIARIIEEEKKKIRKTELTPEQKLIGDNFSDNKGRLPWPVERGIITSHFGSHQHPVLKYVTEQNYGIEITSIGKTIARSIFKGEVSAIFAISGANMTVIIRHGKYLSVYNNLIRVKVKAGEKVETKQEIGEVFTDPGENNTCILKLLIFDEKYLDPEMWIAKK